MYASVQLVSAGGAVYLENTGQAAAVEEQSPNTGVNLAKFANVMETVLGEDANEKRKARYEKQKKTETRIKPVVGKEEKPNVNAKDPNKVKDGKVVKFRKRKSKEDVPILHDETLGWAIDLRA